MTPEEIELTRRRLEEQVKAKVEADLFRYYRNVGSIVVAVLASVGIFVGWPQVKALIVHQVDTQVEAQVKAPVEAARSATQEAEKTAREADKIASAILERLEERQLALKEDIGRINARYDAVSVDYGTAKSRLAEINTEFDALQQAVNYFRDLAKRDPVGRAELESLKLSIANIASRAGDLAKAVSEGGSETSGEAQVADAVQMSLEQVAVSQKDAVETQTTATTKDPRGASTVFVQFAGGSREDIKLVSNLLRERNWTVPGEERIGTAAGKHEIRYFYASDRLAAELLRDDYNQALKDAGLNVLVTVPDMATSVKRLPGRGVLEVWLEIPLRPTR